MTVHALPVGSRTVVGPVQRARPSRPASKAAVHDPRWPQVEAALSALRTSGRRAVRIVDADCGAGTLLLQALAQARRLGFTSIEGHGIDRSSMLIGRARAAAARAADPAIGADFEVADMVAALQAEHDLPADIVICHAAARDRDPAAAARALGDAGRIVIDDDARAYDRGLAA